MTVTKSDSHFWGHPFSEAAAQDTPPLVRQLVKTFSITPLTAQLLSQRGVSSVEEARTFLYGSFDDLFDPFLAKGMQQAVQRLIRAIDEAEPIALHGDYDVDGVTATAVLARGLSALGATVHTFIPHRREQGYGVSLDGVEFAAAQQARVLVTLDCGIRAHAEIAAANACGIDVIVLDHHQLPPEGLPPAYAIVNPEQPDCTYPFQGLAAVGLAFKVLQALMGKRAAAWLDCVALGTVADIAPLVSENRILVKLGLAQLAEGTNPGLAALAQVAKLRAKQFTASHLGFVFGPRINASGRMSSAKSSLDLLLADDAEEAQQLAAQLNDENKARQAREREMVKQATQKVENEVNFARDRVIVVWDDGWHPGVIGIVAARLVDRFYRPAIVIALDGETGKGSGRSIRGFHLTEALEEAKETFIEGGGHEAAAGLSIRRDQLEAFRQRINEIARERLAPDQLVKSVPVDLEIALEALTPEQMKELALFEPCGRGNPAPRFLSRGLTVKTTPRPAWERLEAWVNAGQVMAQAVWSKRLGVEVGEGDVVDLVYTPSLKEWHGQAFIRLDVKAVKKGSSFK